MSYSVKTGVMFTSFKFKFKKYTEKWHGGGGFKGTIAFTIGGFLGFTMIFATVTKYTLEGLRECLLRYYGLDTE